MKTKVFKNKFIQDVFYKVMTEYWLDDDTYVVIFQDMTDADGDIYHLEVEYHRDENRITYVRVYDYETIEAYHLVSPCFKKQIEEYIYQKVGVIREGSFLHERNITLELELDVPKDATINELQTWLDSLKFEAVHTLTPKDEKIKLLSIKVLN